MAVLAGGKLRLEGAPHDLIASTRGRVWQKTVPHTQLGEMQAAHEVISHRFFAGEIVVHVLADSSPKASRRSAAGSRTSISPPSPKPAARPRKRRKGGLPPC